MQNRQRRYLGMTCGQIIVLVCLGLVALGGIGFVIKLMGNEMAGSTVPAQPSLVEPATLAPVPTETPLPSSTPVIPTLTFTATTYKSLIPDGWIQNKYNKVEVWTPADFSKKTSKTFLLYWENKNASANNITVSIGLNKDTPTVADLDDYIQAGLKQFTPETTFLEKKPFSIGTYEAKRVKLQVIISNITAGEAIYFIKDGGTIWTIEALSTYDEFHDWLLTFDKIARTFRINP
ncbi:MAG TPA: hypothetical protein VMT91_08920 [Anaerolineales bacterium]|nr:hypothetical protein [Anaerolineales bacterium]